MAGSSRIAVLLLVSLLSAFSASAATAEENSRPKWEIGVGGGVEDNYSFWTRHYSFGIFSESMETGWFGSASVRRAISNSISLRGEISYLRYSGSYGVYSISPPVPRGVRIAEIPAVALGVRLQAGPGGGGRGSVYLDLLPAVFMAHWTEGVKYGDEWGHRERENKVAPGIVLGAGMRLPLSGDTTLEFGPRLVRTGSLGWTHDDSFFTPEEPEGLNEFGLSVSVTRGL